MSSTAVLNRQSYRIEKLEALSGATGYSSYVQRGYEGIFGSSTIIISAEYLSLQNKLEIKRIKELSKLPENWDSDGALKISISSIERGVALIEEIDGYNIDVYFSSPGPNGEILIHLKSAEKEIEFILYPTKTKYVQFYKNQFVAQGEFNTEYLQQMISWLESE